MLLSSTRLHSLFIRNVALETDFLPFIHLGSTADVKKKDLPAVTNATSVNINIPIGFAFDNTSQKTVYVSGEASIVLDMGASMLLSLIR